MRVPSFVRESPLTPQASMTPMIDVVFQLLVYFLCTAGFSPREYQLPADLPPTGASQQLEPSPEMVELEMIQVVLRRQGDRLAIRLNGEPVATIEELVRRLRLIAAVATPPVILDIGATVPMREVIAVYDACLANGFSDIRFAARRRE